MKYYVTKFKINATNTSLDEASMATARELCAALAGYAGYESFEDTPEGVNGYIQQSEFNEESLNAAFMEFPLEGAKVEFSTEVAEDKNWNEEWEKEGFEPIVIADKCCIHDIYHAAGSDTPYPIDIEIDAKQAFGTGTHNTTRMIVGKLLCMELKGKSVLDCGCGTGILSIVAAKCGATDIVAYDIDEWSADNTRHNAIINHTEGINVLLGDASILNSVCQTFDVALANINRNILLNDMPTICSKLHTGSTLIISGFYSTDVPMLTEKAASLGLSLCEQQSSDDWTMLVFSKE